MRTHTLNGFAVYKRRVLEFLRQHGEALHETRKQLFLAEWNFRQCSTQANQDAYLLAENAARDAASDAQVYAVLCQLQSCEHFHNLDRRRQRALQIAAESYWQNVPRPTDDPQFQSLREELDATKNELARIKNRGDRPKSPGSQRATRARQALCRAHARPDHKAQPICSNARIR